MGMYDNLLGSTTPQPLGMLSQMATMPMPALGHNSPSLAASPAAPIGPVSSDDDKSGPSTWQRIAGIIGDALLTGTGHQAVYGPTALAYAKMQPDPLDQAYKRAQIAALQNKPAAAPHYFTANNGDQGAIDASGNATILYHDPTPKIQWLTGDNGDGTKTLIPTVGGIPQMAPQTVAPAVTSGAPAIGSVVAGHKFLGGDPSSPSSWQELGGAAPTAPSPFRTR